jgi:hypothetical protein
MRHHLPLYLALLTLLPACAHTPHPRDPMGEGCIDGVTRSTDLHFIADGSGREYTVFADDTNTRPLDLHPYANRHVTICGPVDPHFRIHNARIISSSPR